jgi:small-conductance mechanosensitive channel
MADTIILAAATAAFVLNVLVMAKAVFRGNFPNAVITVVGATCALIGIISVLGVV